MCICIPVKNTTEHDANRSVQCIAEGNTTDPVKCTVSHIIFLTSSAHGPSESVATLPEATAILGRTGRCTTYVCIDTHKEHHNTSMHNLID